MSEISNNKPGVYEHKDSGAKLVAQNESLADALVSLGFVRVAAVPKPKTVAEQQEQATEAASEKVAK